MTTPENDSRKLLLLVTEDWYFWSHRLPLAREAKSKGYTVIVATRVRDHGSQIIAEGFKLIPIRMLRRNRNPFKELGALLELIQIYRDEQPDIVHHVAVKPVVFGSIAAVISKVPRVVNAIAGLGYVFSSRSIRARLLRPFIKYLFMILLNRANTRTILQNQDDRSMLIESGIVRRELTSLIQGSGVDPQVYAPVPEPDGLITVILASRMLWDKGIKEFVEAAQLLRAKQITARFALVGESDTENPAAVPTEQLEAWDRCGDVEWWGKRVDMPEVFAGAHIVCLPSAYGEGIPKVLIEAAACGRPIVTTDSPGCREIVQHGQNGLLVPVRNPAALANALQNLIYDPALRSQMGKRGREIALEGFTVKKVVDETLALYDRLF